MIGRLRPRALALHLRWLVRDTWPNRHVVRTVHGVPMAMPWSHRLPDYAADPRYAQNLTDLAVLLATAGPVHVIDIGANIDDSALLILKDVDARILAVEPDEIFLPYLYENTADDDRVVVAPVMLTTPSTPKALAVHRVGGTASFNRPASENPGDKDLRNDVRRVSPEELRAQYPDFDRVRLVKSDTDGFDVDLVPAVARAWADSKPVLFFEYDDRACRVVGLDPLAVFSDLAELGYDRIAAWDNGGRPLFRGSLDQVRAIAERDRPSSPRLFWDLAAVHRDDEAAWTAVGSLVPSLL